MVYRFEFRPYQRHFTHPLKTSHGTWSVREGIIVRLGCGDRQGWGEIAPLPWFGSETLAAALAFCRQLGQEITEEDVYSIPTYLPACQFGLESAIADLKASKTPYPTPPLCHLLPTGSAALQTWQTAWNRGIRTFKWKIGVDAVQEELKLFQQLVDGFPPSAKLRLDANGGLTFPSAEAWLRETEAVKLVEFIEQPLTPDQLELMLKLNRKYATPLALDESVATLEQLKIGYTKGWRGIFVIKAAIAGSPQRLRQFCQENSIDAVFSSVFETAIGRKAALDLAATLSHPNRAVGFGVEDWFEPEDEGLKNLWSY